VDLNPPLWSVAMDIIVVWCCCRREAQLLAGPESRSACPPSPTFALIVDCDPQQLASYSQGTNCMRQTRYTAPLP
jgi:hypothetical protein